ncbi:MAG TPA: aminotransferase class I/II-fold pyridoxal phosphate-dependent enzyme [Planctomycetota bacterium]|nr:aminotransferase class I/II-fold pyridoxal phosphate-dependent enzyme [Planctomycetota bacterium]
MSRRSPLSRKAGRFEESVIRAMTRRCLEVGGINLSQGFPGFDPDPRVVDAAVRALRSGRNQYANTWGAFEFLDAIARKLRERNKIDVDPRRSVTVTCGATEAMIATLLATVDPGDEVVVIEPFYENYGPDTIISGAVPRFVSLDEETLALDPDRLRAAFNERTRAVILNTPHNPTGRVFRRDELEAVASLCREHDCLAITDEIYEEITYDDAEHVSLATLPGMAERTVTICGLSKTYSVTGWRLAYAVAAPEITAGIRKMHDFLTVGAPHPLQIAGIEALSLPESYYEELRAHYARRRDILVPALESGGFRPFRPEGSYFVFCRIPDGWEGDDVEFAMWLLERHGVAGVPGSSFLHDKARGRDRIRFHFAKDDETLLRAAEILANVRI